MQVIEAMRGVLCQKVCASSQFSLILTAAGKVHVHMHACIQLHINNTYIYMYMYMYIHVHVHEQQCFNR